MLDQLEGNLYMDFYFKVLNTMIPMASPDLMNSALTPARKIQSYQVNETRKKDIKIGNGK